MEKFHEQLNGLGKRIEQLRNSISTEEATKTAIIMPFFQMLGYDVFNPLEFSPEFIADVGIKKGEKVDYAILSEGKPVILIECKSINSALTKHDSQLFRYFGTTTAKFSILTNGIEYKFFTDLVEPNKMDSVPFFTFNILDLKEPHIQEIAKFRKDAFDVDNITSTASELKYLNALKVYLNNQFNLPSEPFVKFLVNEIYDGVKTKSTLEKFTPIIQKGLKQIVNEMVNQKLNAALKSTGDKIEEQVIPEVITSKMNDKDAIVTTNEELEAYSVVRVALKEFIDPERIYYRDNKSYFNILLDDNIRKWLLRIYFEKNKNYIVLNDGTDRAAKTIIEFERPLDLFDHKDSFEKVLTNFM